MKDFFSDMKCLLLLTVVLFVLIFLTFTIKPAWVGRAAAVVGKVFHQ